MTITQFVPSQLDQQFNYYQYNILKLYDRYIKAIEFLDVTQSSIIEYFKSNNNVKMCQQKYLSQQNQIFNLNLNSVSLNQAIQDNLYGLTRTRVIVDNNNVSTQCSIISHNVDFQNEIPVIKTYENGVYKAICDRPNVYYIIDGKNVTLNVDGTNYIADIFEFVSTDTYIVATSDTDFNVYQYNLLEFNDTIIVNQHFSGIVELSFKTYINCPIEFWIDNGQKRILIPTNDNVYKVRAEVQENSKLNFRFVTTGSDTVFTGIIRCLRWWNL